MTLPYCKGMSLEACCAAPDNAGQGGTAGAVSEAGMIHIEDLLSKKIGLEPQSIGRKRIADVVGTRMELSLIDDVNKYLHKLKSDPAELEGLIEDVTVPETWFFRDNESFNYLKKYAHDEKVSTTEKKIFRVLSVPCSTGEEPYSIAMTLLEAGLLPVDFQIDAVDINPKTIATAKRAVYGKSAFRGGNTDYRDTYFAPSEEGFVLDPAVAALVNFYSDNFTQPHALWNHGPYQAIFCKNLLIYLTDDARKKVFDNINRLLVPKGIVFNGHAELISFLQYGYKPIKHPRSFACMKMEAVMEEVSASHTTKRQMPLSQNNALKTKGSKQSRLALPAEPLPRNKGVRTGAVPKVQGEAEKLAAIRELADAGSLDRALSLCRQFVKKNDHNKEAYYLAGLINLALNNFDKAEGFFQKVLYLDPSHYEALLHMKLLYEKKGDHLKASAMQGRIKRSEAGA